MPNTKIFAAMLITWFLISSSIQTVHSADPLSIEFLWYEPCAACPGAQIYYQVYLHNSRVVIDIQGDYGSAVLVEWIEIFSPEGQEKVEQYDLNLTDCNTIVVNHEVIFKGGDNAVNETEVREVIDAYLLPPPVHDIAVLNITTSNTSIQIGESLAINVTVKNNGNQIESFNVTVAYDDYDFGTLLVQELEPDTERVVQFHWNTQNVTAGNYTLRVVASSVENETVTDDNSLTYNVEVREPYTPPTIKHDVAVISVNLLNQIVEVGQKANITVIVKNNGTEVEDFNVTTYYNDEFLIQTQLVTELAPNSEQVLTFLWETSGLAAGNYTIRAEANQVVNESYLENNLLYASESIKINPLQHPAALLALAFSFGFFETFSPCLIIMLSFILGFTISETAKFRKSFVKVMLFGLGFVSAAVFLSLLFALVFLSLPMFQNLLTVAVCIFAILLGLNLLGFLKIPFETKHIAQKLAEKYMLALVGMLILGFVFYFLDPCIAPIFIAMITAEPALFRDFLPLTLLTFSIGAIIPFIIMGLLAGSISKLTRSAYRHRLKIRAISGLILIGYALYLLYYILPRLLF